MKNKMKCEICGCGLPLDIDYNICEECALELEREREKEAYYAQFNETCLDEEDEEF